MERMENQNKPLNAMHFGAPVASDYVAPSGYSIKNETYSTGAPPVPTIRNFVGMAPVQQMRFDVRALMLNLDIRLHNKPLLSHA